MNYKFDKRLQVHVGEMKKEPRFSVNKSEIKTNLEEANSLVQNIGFLLFKSAHVL